MLLEKYSNWDSGSGESVFPLRWLCCQHMIRRGEKWEGALTGKWSSIWESCFTFRLESLMAGCKLRLLQHSASSGTVWKCHTCMSLYWTKYNLVTLTLLACHVHMGWVSTQKTHYFSALHLRPFACILVPTCGGGCSSQWWCMGTSFKLKHLICQTQLKYQTLWLSYIII